MKGDRPLIVISGGGTGGPSTAPLALASAFRHLRADASFLFVGNDPVLEKRLFGETLLALRADYLSVPAGKWRRYFSFRNFSDLFNILSAFIRVYRVFRHRQPALIVSAGSFASVPVVWAGKLCGAKVMIHQQDLRPGLANRLMSPFADKVSVSFSKSLGDYGAKARLIGNPSQASEIGEEEKRAAREKYSIVSGRPFILVTGGGSGALGLNKMIFEALPNLPRSWQILHLTGTGKGLGAPGREGYQVIENLSHGDFSALLASADLVISRAGLGALTELSLFARPTVLIPMPGSHQEENAAFFVSQRAAEKVEEGEEPAALAGLLIRLMEDSMARRELSAKIAALMPRDAAEKGAEMMDELTKQYGY
ncbi:MAG: UDP-N-acetylglucosamine--N-acetylmuramyl-(pentapeptide) pyrophosphoryl-undecaprenol N-acetylglucosamine transferase [Bacillota bacterium]